MAWIDITRNIYSTPAEGEAYKTPLVRDLFVYDRNLYAIVQTRSRSANDTIDYAWKYEVCKHLGADPPIVDTIWGNSVNFPPIYKGITNEYKSAGKVEWGGYIYIANESSGEIYRNSTTSTIDGDWIIITGPFGSPEYVGGDSYLRDIKVYNNTLYAAARGGVSKFTPSDESWEMIGRFSQGPGAVGYARSLLVLNNELYVGVKYNDVGIIYKYNDTVSDPNNWIKVAELPTETTDPYSLLNYNGELVVVCNGYNRNIFYARDIGTDIRGQTKFLQGYHLKGIPTSALKYAKDGALWVTCNDTEASQRTWYIGDLNGDGIIDSDDFAAFAEIYSGYFPVNWGSLDVNGDGAISIADATYLLQWINGNVDAPASIPNSPYNTFSRNKILGLEEPPILNITQINDIFDFSSFSNPVTTGSRTIEGAITASSIKFPETRSSRSTTVNGLTNTDWNTLKRVGVIYSNPIGLLVDAAEKYTVSFTVNTTVASGTFDVPGDAHINALDITQSVVFVQCGISYDESLTPDFNFEDTLVAPHITTISLPFRNNSGQWQTSLPVQYSFTLGNLSESQRKNARVKIIIDTPDGYSGIIGRIEGSTYITDIPDYHYQPTMYYYYYSPVTTIKDLAIDVGFSIITGASYISKYSSGIPQGDLSYHHASEPSGPDQWYVKLPGVTNSQFQELRWPSVAPLWNENSVPEEGKILRRIISTPIDLSEWGTFDLNANLYVAETAAVSSTTSISFNVLTDKDQLIYTHTFSEPRTGEFLPLNATFDTSGSYSPTDLVNSRIEISVIDEFTGAFYYYNFLSTPDVYLSDVNLLQLFSGSPENYVYKYLGGEWIRDRTTSADPIISSGVPKSHLTQNWDIRSQQYQLYSVGGGKVWVWNYPGGLYSGSVAGVDDDIRPQIISVL